MRKTMLLAAMCGVAVLGAGAAQAAIIADGSLDADYGAPLWVSQNSTSMAGSTLNAAYATVQNGNLCLFFAGNLANGNRLDVLIDNGAGTGQNILLPAAVNTQGNYARLSRSTADGGGLKLDAGFNASYYITMVKSGNADGYVNTENILTGVGGYVGHVGGPTYVNGNAIGSPWKELASDGIITGALDTSSTVALNSPLPSASVLAGDTTGTEFVIPLSTLSSDGSNIKIAAFIANDANDTVSNQMIGLQANYTGGLFRSDTSAGDPWWQFKMNDSFPLSDGGLPGQQFVAVPAPEPASLALLGLGAVGLLGRRRR